MTLPQQNGNGTGNGNGNGLTQKEMLARIEAKLDGVTAKLEALTIQAAVHEARPFHNSAHDEVEQIRRGLAENKTRLAAYAGGIAVAVFVVELAARILA